MPNLEKIIEVLQTIKKRKGMYFIPSAESADSFLSGFCIALTAAGIPVTWESWKSTLIRRGCQWNSCGFVTAMKAKGLNDEEIMDELFESFLDELRRIQTETKGK